MTISDEAVEAAAKAAYEAQMEDGDTPWEGYGRSSYLDYWRDQARAALEAALPYLLAGPHPTMSSEVSAANNAHIAVCPQCQITFGYAVQSMRTLPDSGSSRREMKPA